MGLSQDEQSPLAILEYIEERLMELKEEFCVTGKALCALAKEGISDTNKSELYQLVGELDRMEEETRKVKEEQGVLQNKETKFEEKLTLRKMQVIVVTHVEKEVTIHNEEELGGMEPTIAEPNLEDVLDNERGQT